MTAPMIDRDFAKRRMLESDIRQAVHYAKREMPKVGTVEHPTPYDLQHRYINELLDQLDAMTCPAAG
jgi:hypothetical protein